MNKPLKGFITYSHEDTVVKDKLITRLAVMKQQNELVTWHDNEMLPSDKWREEIFSTHLPDSDLLLYLVSAASLASENCNKELGIALKKNIKPIPIILEDCDWKKHQLGEFQALPDKGKPINEWVPDSKGWQNVVKGIRKLVDAMQSQVDSPPGTPEEELRTELTFQQGNFLLMLGQIGRAIEAYSHAIELNPNDADAYNNRGVAYGEKGEHNRAIIDFNTAIRLNPNYVGAYNNRGLAYNNKGEYDRAIVDFNTAIQLNPNYGNAYYNRGIFYERKNEYDRAIEDYTKVIEFKPDAEVYYYRGVVFVNKGDSDRAITDFTKATQLNPDYAEAYANRGIACCIRGDYDRAIDDFTKAIEFKPDAEVYYYRGRAWLHLKEWEKAKSDLTTARDMGIKIIAAFHSAYGGVAGFQQITGIQLPADLAAMLL